jgi:hypothetical protein
VTLTVDGLEAALRAIGVVSCGAVLFSGRVTVSLRMRDSLGEPVAVTGEGPSLDAAMVDALRKAGAR